MLCDGSSTVRVKSGLLVARTDVCGWQPGVARLLAREQWETLLTQVSVASS